MRYQTVAVIEVKAETDAALLLETENGEFWVPKSLIESPDELSKGDEDVEAEVAEWLCEREGL